MRHRLIHSYFDIDLDRVWDTAVDDLPPLIAELRLLLEKLIESDEAGEVCAAWKLWQTIPWDGRPAIETRRIGQKGIIAFKLGKVDQAEESLRTAIARFRELDMPFDAALFLLYLADLLLTVGRLWEGEHSRQLRGYMVMALKQLEEAIRRKQGMRQAIQQAIARASGIVRRHDERTG